MNLNNTNEQKINYLNNAFISTAGSFLCMIGSLVLSLHSSLDLHYPSWIIAGVLLLTIGFILAVTHMFFNFIAKVIKIRRIKTTNEQQDAINEITELAHEDKNNFINSIFVVGIGSILFILGITVMILNSSLDLKDPEWIIISTVIVIIGFILSATHMTLTFIIKIIKVIKIKNIQHPQDTINNTSNDFDSNLIHYDATSTNNYDNNNYVLQFSNEQIEETWNKGQIITDLDPNLYRKDYAGALMYKQSFVANPTIYSENNTKSYNWTIALQKPLSQNGTTDISNLQPVNTLNVLSKGDNYPQWTTKIFFNDKENIIKEQNWKI